jgi:branched-chain amino acid transport system permease protein
MPRVRRSDIGLAAGVALLILVLPFLLSGYNLFVATNGVVIAIAVLGLGVLTGRAGMISLCQMSLAAIGAWILLWVQLHAEGIPFILAIVIAGLLTTPLGILAGLPALRLRGVNLAVSTLAFAATVDIVLRANSFPGGDEGFSILRPEWIASDRSYFWFCAGFFVVLALGIGWLGRMRYGAAFSAIRHSERATAALGQSVPLAKLLACAISAFCAGISGALLVGLISTASVESFPPLASLTLFALAIMVGARYVEGAIIGGALYVVSPEILNRLGIAQDVGNLLFALGAVIGLKGGYGAAEAIRAAVHRRAQMRSRATDAAVHEGDVLDLEPPGPHLVAVRSPNTNGDGDGTPAALDVRGLTCAYGQVKALDDVDLVVPAGTVAALIGPNGAGKSTFIDAVTGFVHATSGTIHVAGQSIANLPVHRIARLGVRRSFQQDRAVPDLSIDEYVRLGLVHSQASVSGDELAELLAFFDCPEPDRRIADVDVGTRRLIEVAGAVAARPAIVLLDEPAAGLAAAESMRLANRLAQIPDRFGPAVLLVEHDMELVNAAASHIVVLDFGHVIASGPPDEVLADSKVVSAYLGKEFAV